jgi:hypothetical protein
MDIDDVARVETSEIVIPNDILNTQIESKALALKDQIDPLGKCSLLCVVSPITLVFEPLACSIRSYLFY